jgi:hypothetical protein
MDRQSNSAISTSDDATISAYGVSDCAPAGV